MKRIASLYRSRCHDICHLIFFPAISYEKLFSHLKSIFLYSIIMSMYLSKKNSAYSFKSSILQGQPLLQLSIYSKCLRKMPNTRYKSDYKQFLPLWHNNYYVLEYWRYCYKLIGMYSWPYLKMIDKFRQFLQDLTKYVITYVIFPWTHAK